eukprot:gene39751-53747_t
MYCCAGGMWTRDLAASVGVTAPLHACEHYYVLFEGVEGLSPQLPVLRDFDYCAYYKYDADAGDPGIAAAGDDDAPQWPRGDLAGDALDGLRGGRERAAHRVALGPHLGMRQLHAPEALRISGRIRRGFALEGFELLHVVGHAGPVLSIVWSRSARRHRNLDFRYPSFYLVTQVTSKPAIPQTQAPPHLAPGRPLPRPPPTTDHP